MIDIRFTAIIEPVAKGRPRIGRNRGTGMPVAITPAKTRRWESAFAAIAEQHAPPEIIDEPVILEATFVLSRPKCLLRKSDPEGLIPHDKKPDLDNLIKAVTDALKAFWRDDARIAATSGMKFYAEKTGLPRVEVTIRSLTRATDLPKAVGE